MMISAELKELTKTEALAKLDSLKTRAKNAMVKAQKPIRQVGFGLSAVAGGALGGVASGMKPSIARVPTDLGLGIALAGIGLTGAGNDAMDAVAQAGWGMVAGATGRGTHDHLRNWRETRAAEKGDVKAQQIVSLQKQLDALRKDRDAPVTKK